MHFDWNAVLSIVVAIATVIVRAAIVSPKAHDVAAKIRHLADDIAAVIILAAPNAPWAQHLKAVIDRLAELFPDVDRSVLERAATGALTRISAPTMTAGTSTVTP